MVPDPRTRTWPDARSAALLLAIFVVLGAFLRLVYIASEGFWFDEFIIREQARMSLSALMDDMIVNDVHPPLYQLLMQGWYRLTGRADELWLRLPSLIFGVLTIPVAYGLGRRLFDGRVGLWAALFVSVNEFAVYYAQEARAYSLLLLASTATVWAWVGLSRRASAGRLVLYGVCGLAAAYTHAFGLLLLVYLALAWGYARWRGVHGAFSLGRWLGVHVAMGLAYVPWLPSFFAQHERVQGGFWIPEPSWLFLGEYLAKYTGHRLLAGLLALLVAWLVWSVWRPVRAPRSGGRGGAEAAQRAPVRTVVEGDLRAAPARQSASLGLRVVFLVGWFCFLLGVPFVLSKIGQPVLHDKSAIAVVAPLGLAFGLALERMRWRALALGVGAVWVAGSLAAIVLTNYLAQNREAWREMSWSVASRMAPDDVVVLYHHDYDYFYCYRYYLHPALPAGAAEPLEVLCDGLEACAGALAQIESRAQQTGARRMWLLRQRSSEVTLPGLEASGWRLVSREPFNNGVLDVLER